MNTFKLYDLEIDQEDYKLFKKWAKIQPDFFYNNNFLTGFINLEVKEFLPKSYLEFFFFNKYVLKNKYSFTQKMIIISEDLLLEEFIINTIKENTNLPLCNFEVFYHQILIYLKSGNEKNWDTEYQLLIPYWSFLNDMEHSGIFNFNRYIIYLNKNIFSKQKGIQYGN